DVQSARLVGGAVARRGQLAIRALGGNPRLDVVLACGARAEVARGDIDDTVGEFARLQHRLLEAHEATVLRLGILRQNVAEHLELVELVHAKDAAVVPARRSRLATVAGRPS